MHSPQSILGFVWDVSYLDIFNRSKPTATQHIGRSTILALYNFTLRLIAVLFCSGLLTVQQAMVIKRFWCPHSPWFGVWCTALLSVRFRFSGGVQTFMLQVLSLLWAHVMSVHSLTMRSCLMPFFSCVVFGLAYGLWLSLTMCSCVMFCVNRWLLCLFLNAICSSLYCWTLSLPDQWIICPPVLLCYPHCLVSYLSFPWVFSPVIICWL